MLFNCKQRSARRRLVLAITVAALMIACRKSAEPTDAGNEPAPSGEPAEYRATIVRTVEEGERREVSETRIFRSGEKLREEWLEAGEPRAIIWRPDLGKTFLLSIDRRIYTEQDLAPSFKPDSAARHSDASKQKTASRSDDLVSGSNAEDARPVIDPDAIDRVLTQADQPVSLETRALPDQTIDNFACAVFEQRALFADGHVEITRTFSARDLSGLAIRVEIETGDASRRLRVITEWRDIQTEVSPDVFSIPQGFKKADKIDLR